MHYIFIYGHKRISIHLLNLCYNKRQSLFLNSFQWSRKDKTRQQLCSILSTLIVLSHFLGELFNFAPPQFSHQ